MSVSGADFDCKAFLDDGFVHRNASKIIDFQSRSANHEWRLLGVSSGPGNRLLNESFCPRADLDLNGQFGSVLASGILALAVACDQQLSPMGFKESWPESPPLNW